eukprot:9480999-Pyramimonas_sp.AAC.1
MSRKTDRLRSCRGDPHEQEHEAKRLRTCQDAPHELKREVARVGIDHELSFADGRGGAASWEASPVEGYPGGEVPQGGRVLGQLPHTSGGPEPLSFLQGPHGRGRGALSAEGATSALKV